MFNSILIICTGNICRSPYAEEKLRLILPHKRIDSAGVATQKSHLQEQPADSMAIRIAQEFGIDISSHKAKQVTQELVDEFELILAMELDQIEILCNQIPKARHKVFLLGHWSGLSTIVDPYHKDEHAFRQAFIHIDKALQSWKKKLI